MLTSRLECRDKDSDILRAMSDADDVHHELERLLRTRNRAIRKAFRHIDKERKGRLDAGAFREFLKSIGVEVCDDVVYRKVIKR